MRKVESGRVSMNLTVSKAGSLKQKPDDSNLGFGTIFTDHMFNMDYNPDKGWHNPRIEPYGPIVMDPATMVLHYGQSIFEGLKAFNGENGKVRLFRPKDNFERLNRSARRMCIPEINPGEVLDAMRELVRMEKAWIPSAPGTSLYIRPAIVATDPYVGVRASNTYRFFIILSPVGAYYKEGFNPVKIWISKDYVRAVVGGLGEAKTAANYAASLYASEEAHKNGYTQVLWLDGVERKYIEEVGSMNIFFVIGDEIVTPALTGSILAGITRDSVLKIASEKWGMKVSERKISIDEIFEAHEKGLLRESFGTGTAAVISPVGNIKYGDKIITINNGEVGPVAKKAFDTITGIQYGKLEDPFGWVETI